MREKLREESITETVVGDGTPSEEKQPSGPKESVITFLNEHPEAVDSIEKAHYAWHAGHYRVEVGNHHFSGALRCSKCAFCGRSREQVRYDDLPGKCQSIPHDAHKDIALSIRDETLLYKRLLERGITEIPKLVAKHGLSAETLFLLHGTHGYDVETVADTLDLCIDKEMVKAYEALMDIERETCRKRRKKEIIEVRDN